MNKFVFVGLFVVAALCKAQEATEAAAAPVVVDPVEQAIASSAFVLPVLSGRVAMAQLPADQQAGADQVLANAQKQLQLCEDNARTNRLIYVYKICTSTVLRSSVNQIKALEAAAAAASSTAAAPTQ